MDPHTAPGRVKGLAQPAAMASNARSFVGPGMADTRLSIRLDLSTGDRIGPGKIALLEAIKTTGSISAAARHLGMSYRRAWLLVEEVNKALRQPAVAAATGGHHGGGATVTPVGEQVIALYRTMEGHVRTSAQQEFRAISRLVRPNRKAGA
jgi:molybdate transport system regulatory protein